MSSCYFVLIRSDVKYSLCWQWYNIPEYTRIYYILMRLKALQNAITLWLASNWDMKWNCQAFCMLKGVWMQIIKHNKYDKRTRKLNIYFHCSHPDVFSKLYKIYMTVKHAYLFTNYIHSDMFRLERVIIGISVEPYIRYIKW